MGKIHKKLQRIQAELKVPKSRYSDFGKYNYRSLEDIYEAVKPLLDEEGLLLSISDEIIMLGNRFYIKATAVLKDVESESSFCTTAYAREEENKPKMEAAQITGSASSYARKYALNSLFLLDDSKDADTDEYKRNEIITEKEAKRLYDLMQKKGMTEAQIKEWASQRGLKSLYQTTRQQYAEAMKELGLK